MEKRYQGEWKCAMLADYCWTLAREIPTMEYNQQAKKKKYIYIYIFVLNNELTHKRLCRRSIYVVNIIPTQNKFTKPILFH